VKPCHLICFSLVLSIFMGCATISPQHPEFTYSNILDIKVGMTQKEIEAIFGSPDRTSEMTMGTETSDPWPSLIYYYDMRKNRIGKYKDIGYTNTFYYVLDIKPPLLHSWELELVYPERK
jgi:outer membrane protein assembly factor BamE (lipoprotein component of BamABCDE complex)